MPDACSCVYREPGPYLVHVSSAPPSTLDPQDVGVGVYAVRRRSACPTGRLATRRLFGPVHVVWSPSGPHTNSGNRPVVLTLKRQQRLYHQLGRSVT